MTYCGRPDDPAHACPICAHLTEVGLGFRTERALCGRDFPDEAERDRHEGACRLCVFLSIVILRNTA